MGSGTSWVSETDVTEEDSTFVLPPNGSGLANLLCQTHNFYTNDFTTPFGWL